MTKFQKLFSGIVTGLVVVLLISVAGLYSKAPVSKPAPEPKVGGYYVTSQDFGAGITVNGTTVINSSGAYVGAISGTTGAYSSTLSSVGNFSVNTNKFTVAGSSGNTVVAGTLGVTGAVTLSSTLTGGSSSNIAINTNKFTVAASTGNTLVAGTLAVTGALSGSSSILSSSPSAGIGYATGAGCAGVQATNRTTTVVCTGTSGSITLFSAAGQATPQSFTVTDTSVATTDTVIVNQKSGTDLYSIFVTNVGSGSFKITYFNSSGTTTETPVFNFAVVKAVAS